MTDEPEKLERLAQVLRSRAERERRLAELTQRVYNETCAVEACVKQEADLRAELGMVKP